jgi:hypothetical protein
MYRPQEIEAVLLVKQLLYKQRFTIAGARKRLRELLRDERESAAAPDPVDSRLLRRLRDDLEEVRGILAEA